MLIRIPVVHKPDSIVMLCSPLGLFVLCFQMVFGLVLRPERCNELKESSPTSSFKAEKQIC